MDPPGAFSLSDLPDHLLQRVVGMTDASDFFLLRQVSPRFRHAVDGRFRRLLPLRLSSRLDAQFPSLHTLDLTQCEQTTAAQHTVAVVAQLPRLRALGLRYPPSHGLESSQWQEALGRLTRLKLHGEWHNVTALAGGCSSLQHLHFASCELRWRDLCDATVQLADTLETLELERIVFWELRGFGEGDLGDLNTGRLRTLRLHKAMKQFSFSFGPGPSLTQLAAFTSLTHLDLRFNSDLRANGIQQLNALTGLTSLDLSDSNSQFKPADLALLTRLSRVIDLTYNPEYMRVPASALAAAIGGFGTLTRLDMSFPGLTEFTAAHPALSAVTQLRVNLTALEQPPEALSSLTQLRDLECSLRVPHVGCLSGLTSLTRLCLTVEGVEAARVWRSRMSTLPGNSYLSDDDAYLGDSVLSAGDLRHLTALSKLEILRLTCNDLLNQVSLEPLAQLLALRALDLKRARLTTACSFLPLQRLPLAWLRLPWFFAASQLPPALVAAALKGRRQPRPCMADRDLARPA